MYTLSNLCSYEKPGIFCSLTGWLEFHKEDDISKSESATMTICQEDVIREIATPKLLVDSSELSVLCKGSLDLIAPSEVILQQRNITDEHALMFNLAGG